MSISEVSFRFTAGFEEQYPLVKETSRISRDVRQRFDVVSAELEAGTRAYIAVPPKATPIQGIENRLAIKHTGDDTVELRIEKPMHPLVVAALAQTAFEEVVKSNPQAQIKVVGLAKRNLDNPEYDENVDATFGVLGLEGLGEMTDEGELKYAGGDAREVLWVATNALRSHLPPYQKVRYPSSGEIA